MFCYQATLRRLFDLRPLPKFGLERMQILMGDLAHPQNNYSVFHVAGTNGKGSTCAFLESILRAAGYKTGLYTSPHLTCARERIQINRELISEEDFVRLEQQVGLDATFFERMTAMALLYFSEQKVDVAIIEVGLGGRLDATNIVTPVVCGISRIDLDHQDILGDSLEKIAFEKAGIMKPGVPVCWSAQDPVVEAVLRRHCECSEAIHEPWIAASAAPPRNDELGLAGPHQVANAALAVNMILASGFSVSESAIQIGLKNAHWPCRYELIGENILLDGAHNPAGTQALIKTIQEDSRFQGRDLTLWVGMTEGHGGEEIARLWADFVPNAQVFVGRSKSLRALPIEVVSKYFQDAGFNPKLSLGLCPSKHAVRRRVVTGSLYWAGEVRSRLLSMPVDGASTYY
ncbi:MAG: folylpolyglutamate synthase/dihydrofolate synthase family protein [Myxococcaceae bacterium]